MAVSPKETFRIVCNACFFLPIFFVFFLLWLTVGLANPEQQNSLWVLGLFYMIFLMSVTLWSKRNLFHDLRSGEIETFCGELHGLEDAGSFRAVSVKYLWSAEKPSQKFVLFPYALFTFPQNRNQMLFCPVRFQYWKRSRVIVKVEQCGPPCQDMPKFRSKAWYEQRKLCVQKPVPETKGRIFDCYWFAEWMAVLVPFGLFFVGAAFQTLFA